MTTKLQDVFPRKSAYLAASTDSATETERKHFLIYDSETKLALAADQATRPLIYLSVGNEKFVLVAGKNGEAPSPQFVIFLTLTLEARKSGEIFRRRRAEKIPFSLPEGIMTHTKEYLSILSFLGRKKRQG